MSFFLSKFKCECDVIQQKYFTHFPFNHNTKNIDPKFIRLSIHTSHIYSNHNSYSRMCSTNNEEFHLELLKSLSHKNTSFLPHYIHLPDMIFGTSTVYGTVFSLCLWENEFSTTFFIFHIIYQKQINININAEVEKKGKFM